MTLETLFVGPAPRIAVSVAGQGPLVLFLHGIRGNRRNWHRQLEAFSKNFRAAAWDARGYGDSDDYDGALQFDHFSGDVLRVAEHLRAKKLHLVGLSMGGRIARNVALHYPERLHTLTLVSTTPGFDALSADDESYRKTLEASVAQDRGAPLENIRVRTLVIAGNEDRVYPPTLAREVARRIPGAELVMVEGAGHLVNLEQPERFSRIVLDFLTLHRE